MPVEERPDAEATSTTATAVVVVERSSGPGDATRGDAVIARFIRVRQGAVDEQALRIAGIAGASGSNGDLPAIGACSSGGRGETETALQPRSVDLLDVGVLTVDSAGYAATKNTVLLPRAMPDPTGVVSGVFYSARSTEAFTPAARLQLHTSGGPDMPEGFQVNVASPRDVTEVRVGSNAAAGLDITWDPADANDTVYVDVLAPSARLVARCTASDVGHFSVPASALGTIGFNEDAQLAVHRLHRESFRAKGIEPGEIRFDVARVVTFRR